jgi:hypothetical protein
MLLNVSKLVAAHCSDIPGLSVPAQRAQEVVAHLAGLENQDCVVRPDR